MEATKVIFVAVAALAAAGALFLFNRHTFTKFQYKFFTLKLFTVWSAGVALLLLGLYWARNAEDAGVSPIVGMLVLCMASLVLWVVLFRNFVKTNFVYGVGGSLVQIAVFSMFAYAGIFAAILSCLFVGIAISLIQPVYVFSGGRLRRRTRMS